MELTTQTWIAIGVLALLLCLRRRRTGMTPEEMRDLKRQQNAERWSGR